MNMLLKKKIKIVDLLFLFTKISTQKVYKINKNKVNFLCTMSIDICTLLVYNKGQLKENKQTFNNVH